MLHEPEQGLSMRLFTLLDYPALAEVSRRQREEAAARAAAEAAAQHAAAAAAAAQAAAAQQQQGGGAAGGGPGGQGRPGWLGQQGGMDGGSGGGGGEGEGELYEPSPTYDQPLSPERHYTSAPELYSPSRADWDDVDEAEGPQQAAQQAQQAQQAGQHAQQGAERQPPVSGPLPNEAILEAAGDYPAGFAPRVVLPEVALRVSRVAANARVCSSRGTAYPAVTARGACESSRKMPSACGT